MNRGTNRGVRITGLGSWWMVALLCVSSLVAEGSDLRLIEAVRQGDRETLRLLLKEPVDVNVPQGDGTTALHWAAHRNDLEAAELLIGHGANRNAANDYGVTSLSLACTNGNAAMVEKLLKAGADPNSTQWTGETVLMTCAHTGNLTALKSLLAYGADPNAKETHWEQTALMWALAAKHPSVAERLVEGGADVQARSKAGFTPLTFAAQQGDMDSVRMLLAAGADVNETSLEFGNVLTMASASGHQALSIFLLEKGADPNSPDSHGVTPLHHAVQQGLATLNGISYDDFYRLLPPNMPELVKALLAHGADPNARTTESVPLGPEGRSQRRTGHTALFLAALSGDAEIIRVLADNGADVLLAARGNTTPLMAAAGSIMWRWRGTIDKRIGDPLEAVKVMVELGADIHATNRQGQTAMHAAGFAGEDEVIQFLADKGAKVDVQDRSGQTPWTMAKGMSPGKGSQGRYGSHPSAADLLLKLGGTERILESVDEGPGTFTPVPEKPDQ